MRKLNEFRILKNLNLIFDQKLLRKSLQSHFLSKKRAIWTNKNQLLLKMRRLFKEAWRLS